ncbi:winged helix-turn-helix transcriptional regulator [archaeon]|jgi:DNA-binding transcriptional ArsR family regulator|nr:winged helix-turn-helix transcriptional regulator [archaeon]
MNKSTYYLFFSNLSSQLRISIVEALKDSPSSVTELSSTLKIEQSKLSHALKNLRCCNIVSVEQKGKQRIYSLNKKTIVPILELIDKHAKTFCSGGCAGQCQK